MTEGASPCIRCLISNERPLVLYHGEAKVERKVRPVLSQDFRGTNGGTNSGTNAWREPNLYRKIAFVTERKDSGNTNQGT